MFSVTYLGHQGWLIRGGDSRILVDPLLTDEYSPGFSAEIYPPRRFAMRRFPPVDAVVLSHEHADHLSLPSLALLDRAVPVVLPARSARPLRDAIAGLGFRVVASRTGDRFARSSPPRRAGGRAADALDRLAAFLYRRELSVQPADRLWLTASLPVAAPRTHAPRVRAASAMAILDRAGRSNRAHADSAGPGCEPLVWRAADERPPRSAQVATGQDPGDHVDGPVTGPRRPTQ